MVTWHGPCQMTATAGHWLLTLLSQFIVYGGGGMLWHRVAASQCRADPPPARLVTQPPTGSAAPATIPHSGKTNASHSAQLMMGGGPFLITFLWFCGLLHSLFVALISLSWRLPSVQGITDGDWPGPGSHVPIVPLSLIQIIHHTVSTFAYAESRVNGT